MSRTSFGVAVLAAACLAFSATAADKPDPKKPKHPANHLARESSPYLLQHAHNPVDWYPWGEAAFAKAKKENKIVFLSIGYSSCHWCHVMERESFSNEAVAKILNEHFVCIKVDREERPDIDQIYMTALHVYGERGGWPLSMFLTAEGKPIFGGTYFPPEDREIDGTTYAGFKSLAKRVQDLHTTKGEQLEKQAEAVAKKTAELLAGSVRGLALVNVDRDLVSKAVEGLREEFDKVHGGFGSSARDFKGTKFPTPPYLRLLQYEAARPKPPKGLDAMIALTLEKMAHGGIYDQLGGGFHRYSTERTWTVPHFEKMLYDNGQLVEVYADAYRRDPKPLYRRIVDETLSFLAREMTHPEGGFYSALDADSEDEEGKFYVWTGKEISDTLGDNEGAKLIQRVYGVDAGANFEEKYHIFVLPKSLADRAADLKITEDELIAKLAPLKQKLFEARAKRERPMLDTKVLTAWNGEMIAGCALAGEVFKEPKYTAAGVKAAEFVLSKLQTNEGRLLRTYGAAPGQKAEAKLNAFLDDYAFFVHGLLCLHDATGAAKWLDEAKRLTDQMVKHHHDDDVGGFFYTAHDHEKLFARAKDAYDGAQPSGNSMAARNLVRLWIKTKDEKYRKLADKTFHTFATHLDTRGTALTTMAEALAMFLDAEKSSNPRQ